ncbi:hypothetical protein T484DRAFT_1775431 [Baffinella frigidus]|nr:hypothetical protein T484DRAFT_1775431 [Cryptophyta sp. CCMP2293]
MDSPVFDIAPPANTTQQQAAHAEAHAQAEALNAIAQPEQTVNLAQATGAHSGSTTPAAALDQAQINTLLTQGMQQLQQVVLEQHAERVTLNTPPRAASARHNNIAFTPYDINNPGTLGTTPAHEIKKDSALDFAKATTQFSVTDWLMAIKQACNFHRVDYPAAFASRHLIKDAGNFFNTAFEGRDVYTITWGEFHTWLLDSPLYDRLADQRLLDDVAGLQQGNSSIKEFSEKALRFYGGKNNHASLSKYPEDFWVDVFKRGIHPEIKSRLPIVDSSTTLASIIALALNIGEPLEASGRLRPTSTIPYFQPPFRGRGGGGFRGGGRGGVGQQGGGRGQLNALAGQFPGAATSSQVGAGGRFQNFQIFLDNQLNALANSPTPPATVNESTLAIWERTNLNSAERRAARIARGACTYCGLGGHTCFMCPQQRITRGVNTFSDQGTGAGNEYFDINSGGVTNPNA